MHWYVAVALLVGAILAARALLRRGRMEAWVLALNTIVTVSKAYGDADERDLTPWEADVAQTIGSVMPDLAKGYAREQEQERALAQPRSIHSGRRRG